MTEEQQIRILKKIVKTLGVVLIIGTILVFTIAILKLVYKSNLSKVLSKEQKCITGNIDLKLFEQIKDIKIEGNIAYITTKDTNDKAGIWVCSNNCVK